MLFITVNEILVDAGLDTSICKGAAVVLGGNPTGAVSSLYNWIPANSLDNPTKANPIAIPRKINIGRYWSNKNSIPGSFYINAVLDISKTKP